MTPGTLLWIGVWTMVVSYVLLAVLAFIMNLTSGPVTPGLALMRGLLWPLWLMGLIPGEHMRMD